MHVWSTDRVCCRFACPGVISSNVPVSMYVHMSVDLCAIHDGHSCSEDSVWFLAGESGESGEYLLTSESEGSLGSMGNAIWWLVHPTDSRWQYPVTCFIWHWLWFPNASLVYNTQCTWSHVVRLCICVLCVCVCVFEISIMCMIYVPCMRNQPPHQQLSHTWGGKRAGVSCHPIFCTACRLHLHLTNWRWETSVWHS